MRLPGVQDLISDRTADEADAFEFRVEDDPDIRGIGRDVCGVAEDVGTSGDAGILATGASVSLSGGMAARGLGMITQVLMARLLGAANFGLYAIGWTLIRVLETVNTLGLASGVIYFGANYERNNLSKFKGTLRQSIALAFFTGFTIGAVLYLSAPALAEYVFRKPGASPVIRAFAPALPVYAVFFVGDGINRLSQRMQYCAYSSIGSAAFALVLFCLLFLLGWGVKGAVVATVCGIAVGAVLSIYFVRGLFPAVFAREIRSEWLGRELLAFSVPVALAGLASALLAFVDRLFVAAFCSSAETGIYQAASQVAILFSIIFGAFDSIFSPMVADLHARGENRRLAELYLVCAKWRVYACTPFFLIVLFAPVELVRSVYGSAYTLAAVPLMILSAGQLFAVVAGNSQTMLIMTGQQRTVVLIVLVTLLLDLVLNFVLVPRFGLVGAASAAAISAMVFCVSTASAVRRHASISPLDIRYAKSLGAASVACVVLYILRPLEITTPTFKLFIVAGVSVATFTGCLVAFGLDAEDREVLDIIRTRLRRLRPLGHR